MTKSDDERAWVVRVNLLVGQAVVNATVDGEPLVVNGSGCPVFEPDEADDGSLWMGHWPFGGEGSLPAGNAGNVVEIKLPASASKRKVEVVIGDKKSGGKKTKAASKPRSSRPVKSNTEDQQKEDKKTKKKDTK